MTIETLKQTCPAVFADSPHPDVSDAYDFLPSQPIVERLLEQGWTIRSAHQNNKTDPYATHRIIFDVPGAPRIKQVGEVWPTATFYNSHNRQRRGSFSVGFFRTWCSNQCQVSVLSTGFDKIHLRGSTVQLDAMVNHVLEEMNELPKMFEHMNNVELNVHQRIKFGQQVLSIQRYNDTSLAHLFASDAAETLLTPRRDMDRGNRLWNVYNVAQEAVLNGSRGGVKEVNRNRKLNLEIWNAAKAWLN